MAGTAVLEHHTTKPDNDDLEALISEHRYWRARLREAIEDNRRVRTNAAVFREYCRSMPSKGRRLRKSPYGTTRSGTVLV
jgi:hypothetical protein